VDVTIDGNHILVQTYPVHVRVAPVHVGLAVVVDEDGRVDVLPVLLLPDERLPERVLEGAEGRVRHQHADAVAMDRAVHVNFPFLSTTHSAHAPFLPSYQAKSSSEATAPWSVQFTMSVDVYSSQSNISNPWAPSSS
jgi:hypothetical protein